MPGKPWTCPYCQRPVTITNNDVTTDTLTLRDQNADGKRVVRTTFIVCPNVDCRRFTLNISIFNALQIDRNEYQADDLIRDWQLIPDTDCKSFPDYIPPAILLDYKEACLVKDLSPKASATLARRCLQGMIRDFWQVKPGKLGHEIEQIRDKIDPLCWQAIDSIRKIGNVGAHMEHDVNLIVEIEPNEAELLITLVEHLLEDWYVQRHDKQLRFQQVVELAKDKRAGKKSATKEP